jgi:hypothetical protein
MPFGSSLDPPILLGEEPVFHPVKKDQTAKEQQEGREEPPLQQGVDRVGKEVVADILGVDGVLNSHGGSENVEQKLRKNIKKKRTVTPAKTR